MQKVTLKIDRNTQNRYVENYINSVDLWCAVNCTKPYSIEISETIYHFPVNVSILFEDKCDATYFKLSPLWRETIQG